MAQKQKDFDLTVVMEGFKECRERNEGLCLENYVTAFTELCRFFKLMGTLFGFVAKDIESKLQILNQHLTSEASSNYETIRGMMDYEMKENILYTKQDIPSGSRTLLRLHRALEFIMVFMKQLAMSEDSARTSEIASNAYDETLSRYHPWIVRKMAFMAMYTLPSKAQLIEIMCRQPAPEVIVLIKQTVEMGQPIFTDTEKIYSERGLLELP